MIAKEAPVERFAACFAESEDPRGPNVLHDLRELVFIALLATLCGATNCCDMALFARFKADLLRTVLKLKHGLPSHDTFSRVFPVCSTPQGSSGLSSVSCRPSGLI